MTKRKSFGLLVLLALTISACSTAPQPQPTVIVELTSPPANLPQTEADVPRVTAEAALTALNSGEAVIVDVRSAEAFAAMHIKGALSIPLAGIEADPASVSLDKDQWIITYCTWLNEHTSARAAFLLLQNGFSRVSAILGGFNAWIEAGFPVEP